MLHPEHETGPPIGDFDRRVEATIVLVTRNRREDLRRALLSAERQSARAEVVVMDNASTDGTSEMVRRDFPTVQLERSQEPQSYLALRNRAAHSARAPVIISIDDDAEFSTPHTVAQTLREFDNPRIGAVSIPWTDVVDGAEVVRVSPAPKGQALVAWAFAGCAYAVRRDAFLAVGGFDEVLGAYGEEYAFALRMLELGYVVRLGSADQIVHHRSSATRDDRRMARRATANHYISAAINLPLTSLLTHIPRLMVYTAVDIRRSPRHWRTSILRGAVEGLARLWRLREQRRPVRRETVRLSEYIRHGEPLAMADVLRRMSATHPVP